MAYLSYNGKFLMRSSKWIDYSNVGPTPVPTFVQQTPPSTISDVTMVWPTFGGDSPTSVDLSCSSNRPGMITVEFYTVNTSTGIETKYGYYDDYYQEGSSNVQRSVDLGTGIYTYKLDVSPISSDLQSGAQTMKLYLTTHNGSIATLTYDTAACGYWK